MSLRICSIICNYYVQSVMFLLRVELSKSDVCDELHTSHITTGVSVKHVSGASANHLFGALAENFSGVPVVLQLALTSSFTASVHQQTYS